MLMAEFSRENSFANVVKFFNTIDSCFCFLINLNVNYKPIILKNFITVAKLSLLNSADALSRTDKFSGIT